MNFRLLITAAKAVTLWSLFAGCGDDPGPANSGALPDAGRTGGLDAGALKCSAGGTGGGSGGSAGGAGTGGTIPASFETVKLVFGGGGGIMPCSAAPCHGVNGVAPPDHPLELPPNDDQQLVDPCNPAESALVSILRGPCGMTPRMPYGCSTQAGDCIPDEYIAAVAQWIANGAARP
jgi:hypothetical protein